MKQIFLDQIAIGVAAFEKWKGDDPCISFAFMTDLHSHLIETDPRCSMRRISIDHLEILTEIARQANVDFSADFGDDGFEVPLKTKPEIDELLERMEKYYSKGSEPIFHCIGNHDHWAKQLDNAFWGAWLKKVNGDRFRSVVTGTDGAFGYYDIPGKKSRVFFLNTSDAGYEGMSEEQLDFVRTHLAELPKDHVAFALTHICPLTRGMWVHTPRETQDDRNPALTSILRQFVKDGGRFAGVFSGDSHVDYFDYEDGINYFVSQGYGGVGPCEFPGQGRVFHQYSEMLKRTDTFDSTQYCLAELVGIKPGKNEVRLFRIGAGGFEYYRGAKF